MGADVNSGVYPDPIIRGILVFTMSVFCLVTVVSNVLVIMTVVWTKKLRTISSVFLLSLCIADLGNGLLTMPFILVGLTYDGLLPLTQNLCKVFGFFFNFLSVASNLSVVAIAIDRYSAIIHCLRYSSWSPFKYAGGIIAWIWIQAITSATLPLFGVGDYLANRFLCVTVWSNIVYVVFMCLFNFIIPLLLMFFCYVTIIKVARRHATRITAVQTRARQFSDIDMSGPVAAAIVHPLRRLSMISFPTATNMEYDGIDPAMHTATTNADIDPDRYSDADNYSPINSPVPGFRRDVRTGIRLIGVILAYVIFWITYVYIKIANIGFGGGLWHLEPLAMWMGLLSCVCNPFMYAIISKRFRLAVTRLFRRRRFGTGRSPLKRNNHFRRHVHRKRAGSSCSDQTSVKPKRSHKMPSLQSLPVLGHRVGGFRKQNKTFKSSQFLEVPITHASRSQVNSAEVSDTSASNTTIATVAASASAPQLSTNTNGITLAVSPESKNGHVGKWLKLKPETTSEKTHKDAEIDPSVFSKNNKANIKIKVDLVTS